MTAVMLMYPTYYTVDKCSQIKLFLRQTILLLCTEFKPHSVLGGQNWTDLSIKPSNVVGSEPLIHLDDIRLSVALALKAILSEQNSTSTFDLVPELAALNKSTHY